MRVTSTSAVVCASSGLNIVASAGQGIYRVASTKYGPLNPPVRVADDPEVEAWSRWDTPGRTIYGGSSAMGAFVEVLEYITPDPPAIPMSELFDDVDPDDAHTFAEQVARELPAHGAMPYRSIAQGWRQARSLYELQLPNTGWFVDITGAESISAMSKQLGPLLEQCSLTHLTMSELTSSAEEMKPLTTGIASWVRDSVHLQGGERPHGIVYPSKWGSTLVNWAMWLRRADDGTGRDPVELISTSGVGRHTKDLVDAAELRGMRIF
ncbi:RES domain-containing protein [Mycolicibacterium setense]